MTINNLTAGTYYISVECRTTVNSLLRSDYSEYITNLDVLNGVAYTINADWSFTDDIDQINDNDFKIYPNPFSGSITLETSKTIPIDEITITDQLGNTVFNQKISNSQSDIRIDRCNNLPAGLYFLRIRSANRIYVKRIIKTVK